MNQTKETSGGSGLGFGGALFLLFLGLKLGGVIAWSWWWVTSPLWLPVLLVLAIATLIYLAAK
tara:strand:- start:42355 stop:42543 length:189 start_codon:yes stop_codon:yes gene_type:complete